MNSPESRTNGMDPETVSLPEENGVDLINVPSQSQPERKRYHRQSRGRKESPPDFRQKQENLADGTASGTDEKPSSLRNTALSFAENILMPLILTWWVGILLSVFITMLCESEAIPSFLGASTAYAGGSLLAVCGYEIWLSYMVIIRWGCSFRHFAKRFLPFSALYAAAPVFVCLLPEYGEPVFTYLFLPFKALHFAYQLVLFRFFDTKPTPLMTRTVSAAASGLFLLLIFFLAAWIFHAVREKEFRD